MKCHITNHCLYQKSFWNFNSYRLQNLFIDCYLKSKDQIYPCHKIILSLKSRYFYEYFKSKSESEIELPINPNNFFNDILIYLYTGDIHLNSQNIALACKFSEFYGIDCLKDLIQHQFKNILTLKNCLNISKSLRANGIQTKDDQIAEIILKDFLMNKIDKIEQTYSSISPNVLSKILVKFNNIISDDQKINLIEEYLVSQGSIDLNQREKEVLASVIDWSNPNSYKYVVNYKCDWVPSNIIKPKINQILNIRRTLIQSTDDDFKLVVKDVSKFYPLFHIFEISHPHLEEEERYDVSHLLSTIGDIAKNVNILNNGFIQVQTSYCLPDFIPQFIFDQDDMEHYFVSFGSDQNHPYLTFSFGKEANFLLTQIEIQTFRLHKEQGHTRSPKRLFLECYDDENKSDKPLERVELDTSNGISKIKLSLNKYYQYYRIAMNDPDPIKSWVLRIVKMKIYGNFNK